MSEAGVTGLKLMIDDTLAVLRSLDEAQWDAASSCPGWSVKDVALHLAASFTIAVDPAQALAGVTSDVSIEAVNDAMVDAGAHLTPAEVLASYEKQRNDAVAAVTSLQAPDFESHTAVLGDVGTYPVHWFADALCFDHFCHLHFDLLVPRGPVHVAPSTVDAARLSPTLDWLIAVVPQWSGAALAQALTAPVDVLLTGIVEKRFQLRPGGGDLVEIDLGASGAEALIASDAFEAVAWLTGRTDKAAATTLSGDVDLAGAALSAMRAV